MVQSPRPTSRRQYLAAIGTVAGAVAVAGCPSIGGDHGATDVIAYNATAETVTVSITVTPRDSEDPHTSKTLDIEPYSEVDPVNDGKLPTNDSYSVTVDVENGPTETFEWDDPRLDRAPLYVFLDGSDNVDFLLKAG